MLLPKQETTFLSKKLNGACLGYQAVHPFRLGGRSPKPPFEAVAYGYVDKSSLKAHVK
jgi:hypothetical protein